MPDEMQRANRKVLSLLKRTAQDSALKTVEVHHSSFRDRGGRRAEG